MKNWILFTAAFMILIMQQNVDGGEKQKACAGVQLPVAAEGWKRSGQDETYEARAIFDYIDGAGEMYLAYNFRNLTVRQFEKSGHPRIVAELYDMGSSNDAYGIFSFERQDEEAGIGQGSEFGGGLLRFWKGKFFVSIFADGDGPDAGKAILSLGKAMADSIPSAGQPPKLISALPGGRAGLVEKSVRFLHSHILLNQRLFVANRNILNLNSRSEAVIGQYLRSGNKIHLLLVRYPEPKEAEAALQSFRGAYMPDHAGRDLLQTEDGKWTATKKVNECLLIVFGASSEQEGKELIRETEKRIGEM